MPRRGDHEQIRSAAMNAAAERRAIRALIERIFAEAEPPSTESLADWLLRDPPANRPPAS
jgi:hypothetical protein